MKKQLQIGDRVQYTRPFLQIIGAYTGWYPQAKGRITRFIGKDVTNRLACIQWENPSGVNDPQAVNVFNLQKTRQQ